MHIICNFNSEISILKFSDNETLSERQMLVHLLERKEGVVTSKEAGWCFG